MDFRGFLFMTVVNHIARLVKFTRKKKMKRKRKRTISIIEKAFIPNMMEPEPLHEERGKDNWFHSWDI